MCEAPGWTLHTTVLIDERRSASSPDALLLDIRDCCRFHRQTCLLTDLPRRHARSHNSAIFALATTDNPTVP